ICKTSDLRIHGWQVTDPLSDYGADATLVDEMATEDAGLLRRLHPDLPCRGVDVVWSVRKEMARTVEDVLARRTRSFFFGAKETRLIVPSVAKIMARELGYDALWEQRETTIALQNFFIL